jgi:hypothetical protein
LATQLHLEAPQHVDLALGLSDAVVEHPGEAHARARASRLVRSTDQRLDGREREPEGLGLADELEAAQVSGKTDDALMAIGGPP